MTENNRFSPQTPRAWPAHPGGPGTSPIPIPWPSPVAGGEKLPPGAGAFPQPAVPAAGTELLVSGSGQPGPLGKQRGASQGKAKGKPTSLRSPWLGKDKKIQRGKKWTRITSARRKNVLGQTACF